MSSHPFKPAPTASTPTAGGRTTTTGNGIAHVAPGSDAPGIVAGDPVRLLLNAREAAKALGVCAKTLWNATSPRGTIPSVRIGKRVLYSVLDLQRWIDSQTVEGHGDGR